MGLSDRERTGKILYAVKEIIEKGEKLQEAELSYSLRDKSQKLIKFCNKLWPALIGETRNSIHWLFGSSSSNAVNQDNEDLWSVAVCSSIPTASEGVFHDKDDTFAALGFNPLKDMLTIPALLRGSGNVDISIVCEIYSLLENIVYALRRYDDKYLESRKEFSDLIANMQGTCFSMLYDNSDFSDCYIANQIFGILYADHYRLKEEAEYKDVVDEWLHSHNMHHDITRAIGRSGETTKWLAEQHLLLLGSEGVDLKRNRVLVALRMAGRHYYYDHQHKGLLEILAKDKDLTDKKFLAKVNAELLACKKAKTEDDEASSKSYQNDNNASKLYGWNALPEKKESSKKVVKKAAKKAKKSAKSNS